MTDEETGGGVERAPGAGHRIGAAATLLAFAACGGEGVETPTHMVRDSAGIRIVESGEQAWDGGTGWRLTASPRLEIGSTGGDDAYLFDRVMGVSVQADGGVVVANMGDNTLRFYGPDGEYLRSAGGSGEGPEEFFQLMHLRRVGDELYGIQFSFRPMKVFTPSGEFLRSVQLPVIEGFAGASPRGLLDDGSIIFSDFPQGTEPRPGTWVDSMTVVRIVPGAATHDTIARLPAVRYVNTGRIGYPQEFGPRPAYATHGDELYFGFTEDYEIEVYGPDGDLRRLVRRAWEPFPVTREDIDRWEYGYLNETGPGGRPLPERLVDQRRGFVEAMVYPEHHPAFRSLYVDRQGHLWVRRTNPYAEPIPPDFVPAPMEATEWDVFDSDGLWLGVVELPARFVMREIGADWVAGVWKDELDVEFVRVYGLVKE